MDLKSDETFEDTGVEIRNTSDAYANFYLGGLAAGAAAARAPGARAPRPARPTRPWRRPPLGAASDQGDAAGARRAA